MSKRHRLLIRLVLGFEDGHQSMLFPITSSLYILQLLCMLCFGATRVLEVFHPSVVPETVIKCPDFPKPDGKVTHIVPPQITRIESARFLWWYNAFQFRISVQVTSVGIEHQSIRTP